MIDPFVLLTPILLLGVLALLGFVGCNQIFGLTETFPTVPSQVPVIPSDTVSATVGQPFDYQIKATNSPTSYDAVPLPAGLSVNKSTGVISGTPTASGVFPVMLSATNAPGPGTGTGTGTLMLTVISSITFVAQSNTPSDSYRNTVTVSVPTGTVAGHVMLAFIGMEQLATITAPSGWTLVRDDAGDVGVGHQSVYWRVASGSEPASYTWTLNASQFAGGSILSYSGVETSAPVDAHSGRGYTSDTTSMAGPPLSASVAGDMLVGAVWFGGSANSNVTPPNMMTQRFGNQFVAGFQDGNQVADQPIASSGDTGTRTWTFSAAVRGVVQMVALKPA